MDYYTNEQGEVGVLVSYGYGAGWSTWNEIALAYDKRIVEYWLAHKDDKEWLRAIDAIGDNKIKKECQDFLKSIGYENVYLGGFADCELEFVSRGVPFSITEHDGAEELEIGTSSFIVL